MLDSRHLVLLLALHVNLLHSCYLWGTASGECTEDSLDPLWRSAFMPYCQAAVVYPACIPKYQTLPPSREYPLGRWFNHTITKKDEYVGSSAEQHFSERIAIEQNRTLRRSGVNEFGDEGKTIRRFYKMPDCRNAFKNYFCWANFPRCDPTRDMTYPMCRSACENFFISCGYETGLWRCGKSKWFNGYEAEPPSTDAFGNTSYLRDYFPGQPFRQNKYSLAGSELIVCTPAIDGGASSSRISHLTMALSALCIFFLCVFMQ